MPNIIGQDLKYYKKRNKVYYTPKQGKGWMQEAKAGVVIKEEGQPMSENTKKGLKVMGLNVPSGDGVLVQLTDSSLKMITNKKNIMMDTFNYKLNNYKRKNGGKRKTRKSKKQTRRKMTRRHR